MRFIAAIAGYFLVFVLPDIEAHVSNRSLFYFILMKYVSTILLDDFIYARMKNGFKYHKRFGEIVSLFNKPKS